MASICGAFSSEELPARELAEAMLPSLHLRGGDSQSMHTFRTGFLAIRGNAEVSLVQDSSGSVMAAIEGEIYNSGELSQLLGLRFTDDNVFQSIIPLFERFGIDFPRYLNGSFVLSLVDLRTGTVYVARDHLGSRSLFYSRMNGVFAFSSTIRTFLTKAGGRRAISAPALHSYLCSTAVSPPDTLVKDVYSLRPGSILSCKDGVVEERDYWPIREKTEDYATSSGDFAEQIRFLLMDSIAIRASGKGKYGCLLSGGVDTSIVAATLAGLNDTRSDSMDVFSISFDESAYSDADMQQLMCKQYDFHPHALVLSATDYLDTLHKAVMHLDLPVNDIAFVGMYKAFEMTRSFGCTAVFEGEAADEIFYTGHAHAEREFQRYLVIPFWLRRLALGGLFPHMPLGDSFFAKVSRRLHRLGLSDEERRLIGLPSFYRHATPVVRNQELLRSYDPFSVKRRYLAETSVQDPLNKYYYGLLKTFLPDDLLFKNERMASAHGIVNRTPFIDYRLVELAYTIPQRLKIRPPTRDDDGTKLVYKQAIRGLIPNEVLTRKKTRGFSHPSSVWYRGELRRQVGDILFGAGTLYSEYIDQSYVKRLFAAHGAGAVDHDYLLNSILVLELWLRAFLK